MEERVPWKRGRGMGGRGASWSGVGDGGRGDEAKDLTLGITREGAPRTVILGG
jgi:hypothetical protein